MLNDEQKAAYVFAQAVAAQIELQAMQTANCWRNQQGYAPAYSESDFFHLIEKYAISDNLILDFYSDEKTV